MVTTGHDWSCPEWTNYDHVQLGHLRIITKLVQPWMVDENMTVCLSYYNHTVCAICDTRFLYILSEQINIIIHQHFLLVVSNACFTLSLHWIRRQRELHPSPLTPVHHISTTDNRNNDSCPTNLACFPAGVSILIPLYCQLLSHGKTYKRPVDLPGVEGRLGCFCK